MTEPSRKVCDAVDARDDWSCVRCGVSLKSMPGSRHHRKLRSQASRLEKHTVPNLILLCGTGTTGCHGWVHAHPKESYEAGWLVHSWQKPSEVACTYQDGSIWLLTPWGTKEAVDSGTPF